MTALSSMQSAAVRLIGRKPSTFFSSQQTFEVEIVDLLNDVADDIAKSHDWQALTKIHTITGDGTAETFPLPTDYDRMLIESDIFDPDNWAWGYTHYTDLNLWLRDKAQGFVLTPGAWIMLGGEFNFFPAPPAAAQAEFPYISNQYALSTAAAPQSAFLNDTDTFVLPEKLLTLGLIWRYRAQKGMGYAEDMQNYEYALSQAQARDGGSRVIRSRSRRFWGNTRMAYPWGDLG